MVEQEMGPSPEEMGITEIKKPQTKKPYVRPRVETLKISPEQKGRGVFYDVHEALKENGELADFVYKEFHLDLVFTQRGAVELFSKQEEEFKKMQPYFPKEMLPKSVYIVTPEMQPIFERAKLDTRNIYPYYKFAQIHAERRLASRYGVDERYEGRAEKPVNKILRFLGEQIEKTKEKKFSGAIIQERINGISFNDLFKNENWKKHPNFQKLKENVRALTAGLRKFHEGEPRAAYTWHGLQSENVMVETDEEGEVTGRVVIVDTNFTQRPDAMYQRMVIEKLEKDILKPLEEKFQLRS